MNELTRELRSLRRGAEKLEKLGTMLCDSYASFCVEHIEHVELESACEKSCGRSLSGDESATFQNE